MIKQHASGRDAPLITTKTTNSISISMHPATNFEIAVWLDGNGDGIPLAVNFYIPFSRSGISVAACPSYRTLFAIY